MTEPTQAMIAAAAAELDRWNVKAVAGFQAGEVSSVAEQVVKAALQAAEPEQLPRAVSQRKRVRKAEELVTRIAAMGNHHGVTGWLLVYAFPEDKGQGIGSLASGGQVWEATKRLVERDLAQHILSALRMEANGGQMAPPTRHLWRP